MSTPSALYTPSAAAVRDAHISGMAAYNELCAQALPAPRHRRT